MEHSAATVNQKLTSYAHSSSLFSPKRTRPPPPQSSDESDSTYPPIPDLKTERHGVEKLLQKINVAKAVGPDNIPNHFLKECAAKLAEGLACIFQRSIDTGLLPEDWKHANITPVFKMGDKHLAGNYRPVALTSISSKLLEHIIFSHLMSHLNHNKILSNLNHGLRSGFSCKTQLITTLHDFGKSFDQNIQTDIAILDFTIAFDTVPRRKLLYKLKQYGIKGSLHKWLAKFLAQRQMRVVIDGQLSSEASVDSGVPQGTVLGPLLFLCHINDLPSAVRSQVRLFADDCLLYREIHSRQDHIILQQDLQQLEIWAGQWEMKFNARKCYTMSLCS